MINNPLNDSWISMQESHITNLLDKLYSSIAASVQKDSDHFNPYELAVYNIKQVNKIKNTSTRDKKFKHLILSIIINNFDFINAHKAKITKEFLLTLIKSFGKEYKAEELTKNF
jgi:hypothetical protein